MVSRSESLNHWVFLMYYLPWFESYLSNRAQSTKIVNVLSDYRPISHEVPQGSILGLLLFLVHVNDLCDVVRVCGTSMYADDTAIFLFGDDMDDPRLSLQHDIHAEC